MSCFTTLTLACVFATSAIARDIPDPDPARFEQDIGVFEAWDMIIGQMDPGLVPDLVKPILRLESDYVKGNRFY